MNKHNIREFILNHHTEYTANQICALMDCSKSAISRYCTELGVHTLGYRSRSPNKVKELVPVKQRFRDAGNRIPSPYGVADDLHGVHTCNTRQGFLNELVKL